jgi:glycosyltransferase involved in cell wall biosynthesis
MELERRAVELDVADRLHVRDYVPQDQVVAFLRSADVGLVPILHQPNHEIALITKYFEYAHARLPLVVSDVETMARTTRQLGNGEVFTAGDVDGFAAATAAVLADPERYSKAYDQPGLLEGWSWETQAGVLLDLYARLLGSTPRSGQAAA